MNKLVLIDGNAIMHRAFHALPPLTTPQGEQINAVHGFTSMLVKIIEDLNPTHLAVCFDRPEPTFRKKLSKDYQAHRPQMDNGLSPQFPKVQNLLKAMLIPVYDKAGYEADDLIGTISHQANVDEVIVITGDRDILQLVNQKTKVFLPTKGLSKGEIMDKSAVMRRLGVFPEQIVDYKALVGDSSDNYKGVPGIGPVSAEKLLAQYHTLENIYQNLDKFPKSIRDKLSAHKDSALLSQTLAKIITNLDLDFDISQCQNWQINSPQALAIFAEFGMKTAPSRIQKLAKRLETKSQTSLF